MKKLFLFCLAHTFTLLFGAEKKEISKKIYPKHRFSMQDSTGSNPKRARPKIKPGKQQNPSKKPLMTDDSARIEQQRRKLAGY